MNNDCDSEIGRNELADKSQINFENCFYEFYELN